VVLQDTAPPLPGAGTDLLAASAATLLIAAAGYPLLGRRRRHAATVVRWLCLAATGGMAGYLLFALNLLPPPTWDALPEAAHSGWPVAAALAALGAVLCGLLWAALGRTGRASRPR
jgi:hypothetical protein